MNLCGRHTNCYLAPPSSPVQGSSLRRAGLVDRHLPILYQLLYLAEVAVVGRLVQLRVRRHGLRAPKGTGVRPNLCLCLRRRRRALEMPSTLQEMMPYVRRRSLLQKCSRDCSVLVTIMAELRQFSGGGQMQLARLFPLAACASRFVCRSRLSLSLSGPGRQTQPMWPRTLQRARDFVRSG